MSKIADYYHEQVESNWHYEFARRNQPTLLILFAIGVAAILMFRFWN